MDFEYKKINSCKLREVGKDERWLQERISEDPSILGLGDLIVLQREKSQPTGGRIDFLMFEPEEKTRYEIEVMLGTLDESHIIRLHQEGTAVHRPVDENKNGGKTSRSKKEGGNLKPQFVKRTDHGGDTNRHNILGAG
ncbi:MAG: hypothetical protein V1844_14390 [Pseudomonadota bacterium]